MQIKRILVTGGAGFIGSSFVARAVEAGYQVIILDKLTYAGHEENLAGIVPTTRWQLVKGDICDPILVADLLKEHRIEAVINFAAESHVDNSIHTPEIFIKTNIEGTYNLLNQSFHYYQALSETEKTQFRFVQISTDEVYGSLGPDDNKFTENSLIAPNSPYAASKAAGDHLARAWFHTYGFPVIITHCTNNYGPRQFPEKLIPHMIFCALNGKALPVYGKGENIRDWIHVEDHCQGVMLALTKGVPGESYDFGGNNEYTNLTLVSKLCEILNRLSPHPEGLNYSSLITFVTDRLGHDMRYAIDDQKAQKQLGYTHQYKFESGLEQTVRWYLENQDWCEVVITKEKVAS